MITREDVITAYRLLQQREPESEEVIAEWQRNAPRIEDLISGIVASREFLEKMGGRVSVGRLSLPQTARPLSVETQVSPQDLSELFRRIKEQWETIGNEDAHWSVLTDERYLARNIDKHVDMFYATGQNEVIALKAFLARAGIDVSAIKSCFELGCGVGRVTEHLANAFQSVTAADISTNHLHFAQERLGSRENVRLKLLREITDIDDVRGYDLFYSVIVFQHNPPPAIAWMLRTALKNLNSGGVAFFQIPSYYENYRFRIADYLEGGLRLCWETDGEFWGDHDARYTMDAHPLPQKEVFAICRDADCDLLEVREDDWVGRQRHTLSNTYLVARR